MGARHGFLVAVFFLLLCVLFSFPGALGDLESVPDFQKAMYRNIESFPCVRLLNLSGEVGCSNPGTENVIARIVRLDNADMQLRDPSTILLPLEHMQEFFSRVSNNQDFSKNIAGVLIESSSLLNNSIGFSPVEKFPQSAFAPYENKNYEWNLAGSGIMWQRYNFPVFLLSGESTLFLQKMVNNNSKNRGVYPANVAEFDLIMQTTKMKTRDSESCLREQSCLPLGGHSVWSSLPPINVSSKDHTKPIIMAIASMDSASFFRDLNLGADSPVSGLIALLTAVDALSQVHGLNELKKQLVFSVFTGESWGYLGSRKFLQELEMGTDALSGLNNSMIEEVLEIGSVGKGSGQGQTSFYAHTAGVSAKKLLTALQTSSDSLGMDNVTIKSAADSNPGVPPSSLMTFTRKNSSISGVVLEDFDSSFSNKFFHSHLDNISNVNSSSIAAAAALVARALYILASGDLPLDLIDLNSVKVNVTLVDELVGCLLTCDPGMSCSLVQKYISVSSKCPSHYVGVFMDLPSGTQHPKYADDTARFVWNFLADRTANRRSNTSDKCTGDCSDADEVCVGQEVNGGGSCVASTTRYVPAYSTRLKIEDNIWKVIPATLSDPMGAVDPVWTESYWNTISLRAYTIQSTAYDLLVLSVGIGVTVVSYISVIAARALLAKAAKHD